MSDQTLNQEDTWDGSRNEGPGSRMGPFTLLRRIGEGGFGDVYEAEQEQPVKRRVALKIIKLGMDTREVIARFDAERHALAMMEHPHIARVLDAGATASGRPYFVMELVDGESISSYCDAHALSITHRLLLFEQVCEAVQHAHTKGIIHRDLKPSNVLVSTHDGKPFAKVIDFGIAKATKGQLTDKTLATELNQVMGTPLYMSPEQAGGSADIDTRTDIYSLGVILYELLTGTTPMDSASLGSAAFPEIQRIIREVDPPSPSARLARASAALPGIALRRAIEPRKLTRTVHGELDWIVMKALAKERSRRYETANGLAMDLRRYLAGEPVVAAPPSAFYQLRKFVRRNKGAVAAGMLIFASLLVGVVAFAWQARIAQARADELAQVSKFQSDMLGQVDPTEAGKQLSEDVLARFAEARAKAGGPESERAAQIKAFAAQWQQVNATDAARELIDRTILKPAVTAIDRQFKGQPLVDASLRQVLADRYVGMGLFDAAMPLQQRALATRRRFLGEDHADTLASINHMGELLFYQAKPDEAEPFFREALAKRRRILGELHPDTLESINDMGALLAAQGKLAEAEGFVREALENSRKVLGEEHSYTLSSINNLGSLLQDQGKLDEAEPYYREDLEKSRRLLGEEHPDTLTSINNLGLLLQNQGKQVEAEAYLREALEKSRRVLGEEHPSTLSSINILGRLLLDQGKLDKAEPYLREALEKRRRVLGGENPETLDSINNLAELLRDRGELGESETLVREALEVSRRVLGDEHRSTLILINSMGSLLDAQGKHAEAEKLLAPFEASTRQSFSGNEQQRLASFLMHLGKARAGAGNFIAAETDLIEAKSLFDRTRNRKYGDTRECNKAFVELYTTWDNAQPRKGYDIKAAQWQRKWRTIVTEGPATWPERSPAGR